MQSTGRKALATANEAAVVAARTRERKEFIGAFEDAQTRAAQPAAVDRDGAAALAYGSAEPQVATANLEGCPPSGGIFPNRPGLTSGKEAPKLCSDC